MRESAASAKRVWFMFGAKPAQSETPVRAAAKRRPTRKRAQWKEDAKLRGAVRVLGWERRKQRRRQIELLIRAFNLLCGMLLCVCDNRSRRRTAPPAWVQSSVQ